MAGKHSKTFLDSFKDLIKFNNNTTCIADEARTPMLLPYKIIIGALVLSLILSSIWICLFFIPSRINQRILNEAVTLFESGDSIKALNQLKGQNNDIVGWIKIDGTNINNPVCQGKDNSYYMNHNHLGKESRYGALNLQTEDNFSLDDTDRNTVIYGNNMKDGSMFGSLKKLRDINFYKNHPTVKLYYEEERQTYQVFAVMLISHSKDDNNSDFNPSRSHFESESQFNKWIVEATKRSIIKTNVKVNYGEEILTLVTLADDFEGARLVVMAKHLKDVEVPHIDTSNAILNPNIKYPKIWYTTKGIEYPY